MQQINPELWPGNARDNILYASGVRFFLLWAMGGLCRAPTVAQILKTMWAHWRKGSIAITELKRSERLANCNVRFMAYVGDQSDRNQGSCCWHMSSFEHTFFTPARLMNRLGHVYFFASRIWWFKIANVLFGVCTCCSVWSAVLSSSSMSHLLWLTA